MKPLFKLFGFGVYRVRDVEMLHHDFLRTERLAWQSIDRNTRVEIKIAATLQYLSKLRGKRRRASANKIERILKGDNNDCKNGNV